MKLGYALTAMFFLFLSLTSSGCGLREQLLEEAEIPMGSVCHVAEDQRKSFLPPPSRFPLQIIADSSFNSGQRALIIEAAERWNTLGRQIAGLDFFVFTTGPIPENVRTFRMGRCSEGKIAEENQLYIVREDNRDVWVNVLKLDTATPGVNTRCTQGGHVVQQTIHLTTNASIMAEGQFGSVILHELGHSIGLDHSCLKEGAKPGFVGCDALQSSHPYLQAVMNPILRRGSLQTLAENKETLRRNDMIRTQCLHSP